MAGVRWQVPPGQAWAELAAEYIAAIRAAIHTICQRWVPEIENYMKRNAPWTDRTSNARQGLYSAVNPPTAAQVADLIEVIMAHSVIYGSFLEGYDYRHGYAPTQQGGRFAIIEPTLDRFAPLIWADVLRLFT